MLKTLGDFVLFYLLGWFGGHFCFNLLGGGVGGEAQGIRSANKIAKYSEALLRPYVRTMYVRMYVLMVVRMCVHTCVRTYVRTYVRAYVHGRP